VEIKNHQGSFVSGDHCQSGSGGKIYGIKGYSLMEGIEILKNINKNNQSGGVTCRRKTVKKFKKPTDADMFLDAIATGRLDLIEDYLDNNGSVKVRNCKGETALHIAAAHNQNDILERILPYFNEDELDIRDMYGLPPHMTAIKHGNEYGAQLLSQYHKMIRTKPYRFKNYSFATSIKKGKKQPSFQQALNIVLASNQNPVIYPNQNRETINIWSYIPTRPNKNKSPFVLSYNNKNTKKIIFNNKKKGTRIKKKPLLHISRI
jgi:ankyrin repeat protein